MAQLSKATIRYGALLLGSVLTLHIGSTFLKPIVAPPSRNNGNKDDEYLEKLKKI